MGPETSRVKRPLRPEDIPPPLSVTCTREASWPARGGNRTSPSRSAPSSVRSPGKAQRRRRPRKACVTCCARSASGAEAAAAARGVFSGRAEAPLRSSVQPFATRDPTCACRSHSARFIGKVASSEGKMSPPVSWRSRRFVTCTRDNPAEMDSTETVRPGRPAKARSTSHVCTAGTKARATTRATRILATIRTRRKVRKNLTQGRTGETAARGNGALKLCGATVAGPIGTVVRKKGRMICPAFGASAVYRWGV